VASYVALGGACRACGHRIDPLHLLGELLGAAIVLSAALIAPFSRAPLLASLGLILLASSVVDIKTRRLPDLLTAGAGLLAAGIALTDSWERLFVGLAWSAGTFCVLEALRRGYLARRGRPGFGFGDVKLLTALAVWLGSATAWTLVGASVAGLAAFAIIRPRDGRIPFGPAIAAAAWVVGTVKEAGWWPA
jgi:leader peptidase (prepilin peptidase)/N-methyltransferase